MRRTPRARAVALGVGVLPATPGLAFAEPDPDTSGGGDVIFDGPGGSQHVTLYRGDGEMLEAPYTGSSVEVSPVRTSGMTPYVVRYIEY